MASRHDSVRFKTTVYAAIELSKKSWVVAIAHPDRDRPSIHRIAGGNLADLIARLRKAAGEQQRIVVCYEAGYTTAARRRDARGSPRPATAGHDASSSKSHGSGGNTNPAVLCLTGMPAGPPINRRGSGASCLSPWLDRTLTTF
jgi:hypothetical protein